jgi:putative ABC transport system permease protein
MIVRRGAARIYSWALRAFPRRHRVLYAAEMRDAFERELAARLGQRGRWSALVFSSAACANTVTAGLGERRRYRRRERAVAKVICWIDCLLAWRVLVRYPGLTVVGVLGIAVGIAIAGAAFSIRSMLMTVDLPLEGGERIVSLLQRDVVTNNRELRLARDFDAWRSLESLEDLAVARTVERSLQWADAPADVVSVAEISAAAFRVARVSPLIGRALLAEDERPGAPDVIVIGHDEWRRRFASAPDILGQTIQLGRVAHRVVGVMPAGFAFPVNHSFWVPWRLDLATYAARSGPNLLVFARLAPDATLESAQAELAALGGRMAAALPATHEHLRPRVLPYAAAFNDMDDPENALAFYAIEMVVLLLLVIICVNVAILVYARTATRQGEIAVRAALGASRSRIVGQLFVEALMLAAIAAALGLGILRAGLEQLEAALRPMYGSLPFWMSLELSTSGLLYVVALTVLAAGIVGVIPALKATSRRVQTRLPRVSPGSGSSMQLGRSWTALVIAQVALTVAILPATMFHAWSAVRFRTGDAGFASGSFLTAQLTSDAASAAVPADGADRVFRLRYGAAYQELARRLRAETAVTGVTFSMAGVGDERALVAEVEGVDAPVDLVDYNIVEGTKRGHLVRFNRVAHDFFDAFGVPIEMGRGFQSGDGVPAASRSIQGVVVNRALVDTVMGGANPLGRRLRYVGRSREAAARDVELERWYEIVGVVPDFPRTAGLDVRRVGRVYHPVVPGDVYPAVLGVRVRSGEPSAFSNRLRELTAATAADFQLRDLASAEEAMTREQGVMRIIAVVLGLVMSSVIALSGAGIYALMSFTVARRRREIGIRAALGANRNRILAGIFSRACGQLAAGGAIGIGGAVALEQLLEGETFQGQGAILLPLVTVVMTMVGVVAALGPARRGLSIQPIEALREE